MKGWQYVLAVIAVLVVLSIWKRKDLLALATGIIDTPPEVLARADGVTVEVESLARTMQSEESGTLARTAIGLATVNRAKRAGKSITDLVTYSKNPKANGKYSDQKVSGGKYCATHKAPSRETLNLAANILSGKVKDITKGSHQWDAPKTQDKKHAENPQKWKSSSEVAAIRIKEGRKLVTIEGVPNTRFWA